MTCPHALTCPTCAAEHAHLDDIIDRLIADRVRRGVTEQVARLEVGLGEEE